MNRQLAPRRRLESAAMKSRPRFASAVQRVLVIVILLTIADGAIAADSAEIDRFLQAHLERIPVPGFSVVIVDGDEVVYGKGFGLERVDSEEPMTSRSSVAIGSLTKSFTAVAVMQLMEEGLVDLDAPVTRYVPWFRTADGRQNEITIRRLLNNTSGIPSRDQWLFRVDSSEQAMERSVRELSNVKLSRQPGASFEYCNENWILLGLVVANLSGKSYSDALQERVLDPLRMTRSTTALDRFPSIGVLYGHHSRVAQMRPAAARFLGEALAAGSELRASASDLGNYLAMLMGGGLFQGQRVLSEDSVDQLFSPAISFQVDMPEMGLTGETAAYGMGWIITEIDGRRVIHHGGDAIVMGSWTMLDLDRRLAVAVLYNGPGLDPYRFPSKLWLANNLLHLAAGEPLSDFGMPDEEDPHANDFVLPVASLERYAGTYVSAEGFRIDIQRGSATEGLIFRTKSGAIEEERELDFLSESAVVLRNLTGSRTASFTLTGDGEVTGLVGGFAAGGYRRVDDSRVKQLPTHQSPDGTTTLSLPSDWKVEWEGDSFQASSQSARGVSLSGGRGAQWARLAEGVRRPALPASETMGGRTWEKLLWRQPGQQHLLLSTSEGQGRYFILLSTPSGSLTSVARDVLLPLLSDLELATPSTAN